MLEISIPSSLSFSEIEYLKDLINRVYTLAEKGIWNEHHYRTTSEEVREKISSGSLLLARSNEQIVGSVYLERTNQHLKFEALVVDPKYRHMGHGQAIVNEVFRIAKEENYQKVQIEILYPKDWAHKQKEILKKWYFNMGFKKVSTTEFAGMHGNVAECFITECNFDILEITI